MKLHIAVLVVLLLVGCSGEIEMEKQVVNPITNIGQEPVVDAQDNDSVENHTNETNITTSK